MKLDNLKHFTMAKRNLTSEEATVKERFIAALGSLRLAREDSIPVLKKVVSKEKGGRPEQYWTMWLINRNGGRLLGLLSSSGKIKTIDDTRGYIISRP